MFECFILFFLHVRNLNRLCKHRKTKQKRTESQSVLRTISEKPLTHCARNLRKRNIFRKINIQKDQKVFERVDFLF